MASKWLPPYIEITSQTVEDHKAVITFKVRTRHPAWWLFMWRAMCEHCHKIGVNPWNPVIAWAMVKSLAKTIIK